MKKYKCLVSALLCTAMLFVGCNHNPATPDDPADDPTNTEQPGTDETSKDDKKDDTSKDDAKVTYTITFDADGGSDVEAIKIEKDAVATEPAKPTKEGYKFLGWYLEDGSVYDWSSKVTGDIKLKAKWTDKNVVSFDSDGGTTIAAQEVKTGDSATLPKEPVKASYVFAGWFTDAEKTKAATFPVEISDDTKFYAKWAPLSDYVTYLANDAVKATNATLKGSGINLYYSAEGIDVVEGDQIFVSAEVEFSEKTTSKNLAIQCNLKDYEYGTETLSDWQCLLYNKYSDSFHSGKETILTTYTILDRNAGKLQNIQIILQNPDETKAITATVTNVKLIYIPKATIDTVYPILYSKTMDYTFVEDGTTGVKFDIDGTFNATKGIAKGEQLTFTFTVPNATDLNDFDNVYAMGNWYLGGDGKPAWKDNWFGKNKGLTTITVESPTLTTEIGVGELSGKFGLQAGSARTIEGATFTIRKAPLF